MEGQIIRTEYSEVMQKSYIDYAMSVIVSRALPDVRDGLKPVQRRTLYDMYELGIRYDRPYRKCARIVGDTMGKYHPHGDSSIYDALVVMAQDVVGGYAYVGALIHGETEAAYYDTDQNTQDSLPHLAGGDSGAESVVEEGCHVTVDKGIYDGSPADQMAAEDNFHNEDQKVDDHQKVCICHSQAVG